jgi:hypothetical protein
LLRKNNHRGTENTEGAQRRRPITDFSGKASYIIKFLDDDNARTENAKKIVRGPSLRQN